MNHTTWWEKLIGGFLALAFAICLTGLTVALVKEAAEITAGTVVDKAHYDEVTSLIPVSAGNGNFVLVPVTEPECYALFLRDGEETGDVCVDSATWGRVREGDFWSQR